MSNVTINLITIASVVLIQAILAIALLSAVIRNHLKGTIRPAVIALTVYFFVAFAVNFLRLLAIVFQLYTGQTDPVTHATIYTIALATHSVASWFLFGVLSKIYPEQRISA